MEAKATYNKTSNILIPKPKKKKRHYKKGKLHIHISHQHIYRNPQENIRSNNEEKVMQHNQVGIILGLPEWFNI